MTTAEAHSETSAEPPVGGPGARLKAARETAGLSLDQAAQQLKLAPRQVRALEDEDFAHLPGRTFTRGFVRNYARLLNLDPEGLLALMPDAADAPALEAPALQRPRVKIAELPRAGNDVNNLARWLIPLVLVGCVVAAAVYEWYASSVPATSETVRVLTPKVEVVGETSAPPAAQTNAPAVEAPPTESPSAPAAQPPQLAPTATDASAAEAARAETAAAPAATTPAPLVLTYAGPSWTEVRDRDGILIVSRLAPAGSEQAVRGTPPFEIVIGNASAVTLVYGGRAIDLSRYTRQNVARLRLP